MTDSEEDSSVSDNAKSDTHSISSVVTICPVNKKRKEEILTRPGWPWGEREDGRIFREPGVGSCNKCDAR